MASGESRHARRHGHSRLTRRRRTPPGSAPGTLLADPEAAGTSIHVIGYGRDGLDEHNLVGIEAVAAMRGRWPVLWVDVVGLGDIAVVRRLGEMFGLHPLQLEDIVNVHQRAKTELYENNLFVVSRMAGDGEHFDSEQFSMVFGDGWVLTFQERVGDCFEPLRTRLRRGGGRVRELGADYLAYALLDSLVDAYFPVLERFGDRVEDLEEAVIADPATSHAAEIHALRRELLAVRRALWPQRDMLAALLREESRFVTDATRIFLRDCHDHVVQAIDMVETLRDVVTGLLDIYLSSISARMNDVMRVLTVIATLFIPLTFVAGVYGMNFSNPDSPWAMPELHWYYGYPLALALMAAMAVLMLAWFRRRRWL